MQTLSKKAQIVASYDIIMYICIVYVFMTGQSHIGKRH